MGLAHSPRIITANISLCLDAANIKSYVGTGADWNDISGGNYNSALQAAPTYSTDNGGYFTFDGSTQYATIAAAGPSVAAAGTVTQEAVVYTTSTNASNILIRGRTGVSFNYGMMIQNGNLLFRNSTANYVVASGLVTSKWYHLMIVTDANGSTGYVNGVKQLNVVNTTSTNSTNEICIGRRSISGTNAASEYFNGRIALIRIYHNKAFTDEEVLQNFNALRGRYGI